MNDIYSPCDKCQEFRSVCYNGSRNCDIWLKWFRQAWKEACQLIREAAEK